MLRDELANFAILTNKSVGLPGEKISLVRLDPND